MFNNQMMMNGMNTMMGGVQYNNLQAKMTQPLTKEEMAKLQKQGNERLVVNEIDLIKSKCTHKNNGQLALVQNANGTSTCNICGETFTLVDIDPMEVEGITQRFIDILQSIKTFYLDMPVNYASEFFVMIPLLKNTPELYRIALNQFSKYESGSVVNQNNGAYGFNLFNTLTNPMSGMMNNSMNPGMMGMGMNPNMMNNNMMGMNPNMMNNNMMGMNPNMMNNGMMGMNPNMMNNGMVNGIHPFTGQEINQQQFTEQQGQVNTQNQTQTQTQNNNGQE